VSAAPEQLLETIVRAGDVEACLAFFADMPENERRKLAPLARQVLREGDGDDEPFAPCERVALLATASLTEVKRFRHKVLPGWLEDDFEPERRILENRRPAWLQSWCKWALEKGYRGWPLVRALVRDGACPPPETDMYVLGMIQGVHANNWNRSVLAGLRDDPELLENEVWRLFEIKAGTMLRFMPLANVPSPDAKTRDGPELCVNCQTKAALTATACWTPASPP